MGRDRRILQGLTLCRQAAHVWAAALVIRGLTQGQALRTALLRDISWHSFVFIRKKSPGKILRASQMYLA
jgi:hypothetical protein